MSKIATALIALVGLSFGACQNTNTIENSDDDSSKSREKNTDTKRGPMIQFEKTVHDFGEIIEGSQPEYDFKFTNTGDSTLIILNAMSSGGGLVPSWPHAPIAPGEEGAIRIEFLSRGRGGPQTKTVTVNSNIAPSTTVLVMRALVIPKDEKGVADVESR